MGNDQSDMRWCKGCLSKHAPGKCPLNQIPVKAKSSNIECYRCGATGHVAKFCEMVIVPSKVPSKVPSDIKECGHCGGRHSTHECRENQRKIRIEDMKKKELEKKVEVLEHQVSSMKLAEEEMKKKREEEATKTKSGESSQKENLKVDNKLSMNAPPSHLQLGAVPKVNPGNLNNPANIAGFNGPPLFQQPPPPLFPFPQQQYSRDPPHPNQFPSNQNQWNFQNPPVIPPINPPFNNTNNPLPPLLPYNQINRPHYQQTSPPNQQQLHNTPLAANQEQRNQGFNAYQNKGRGRPYTNRGGRGGSRGGRGHNENYHNNYNATNQYSGRGNNMRGRGNRGRALFSNGQQMSTRKIAEGNSSKNDQPEECDDCCRQKKDHQGVSRGRIHKDKTNVKSKGTNNKQVGSNKKESDSDGGSDSASTGGYETPQNENKKKNGRRNRRKKEDNKNDPSNLNNVSLLLDLDANAAAPPNPEDIPLSKNNLGKDDVLLKFIGSNLPSLTDAIYLVDDLSLYRRVEGVMLLSHSETNEMEPAKTLLHIVEFKSKHPNAISRFLDIKN